ncbi:MAG TPA: hypothetical protein ENG87_02560 [Candidatus Pacearchaeota archaeon]|nr:hypothetical protein BMS3Abin17_00577 [archaeon BMS3Abin17]HDK42235.1 hypothetical protein [Candidatus Pacearchaeota archaeon]HDZ60614.1 hypothetical protein [Candidatus Pacearchaeota archaeon]
MGDKKKLVVRPRFISEVTSIDDVSKFFSFFHTSVYRGEVMFGNYDSENLTLNRDFRPDIVKKTPYGLEYTEIKANSTNGSMPHCGINQIENYCYLLLNRLDRGDEFPSVDYSFFRYGYNYTRYLHKLRRNKFIEKLSDLVRFGTILPINLMFFICSLSRIKTKNHEKSESGMDFVDYFMPRGSMITLLNQNKHAVSELIKRASEDNSNIKYGFKDNLSIDDRLIEDLSLKKLRCGKINYEGVSVVCGKKTHTINPFPVTRWSFSKDDYKRWLNHFSKNHKRILDNLGLEDLFHKQKELSEQREKLDDPF